MGFIKVGGKWVSKDGEQGGSSSGNQAEADEDSQVTPNTGNDGVDEHQNGQGDQGNDVPGKAYGVGPSIGNMDDHIASMSPFERLMINRIDSMAYNQRNNYEFYAARFQIWINRLKLYRTSYSSSNTAKIEKFHASVYTSAYAC